MMLPLGVDLRGISWTSAAPGAGVAHVTRELWSALSARESEEFNFIPLYRRRDVYTGPDAVLFPSGAVPLWFRGNACPLVHDLFIFEHPEWFSQNPVKRRFTTYSFLHGLRRADHIFSVSEFTKQQIARHAQIPSEKITAVYQGVETRNPQDGTRVMDDYFLVLGTIEPRKNLPLLFNLVLNGSFPAGVRLVVAGRKGWGNIQIPNHPQIEYVGGVSVERKLELLRHAKALLLPSLGEGFGRTALEAMSVGTPVIASHCAALLEVVGDAGILLGPNDNEAWRRNLERVAEDEELRNSLIRKGYIQAERFTWERTVDLILAKVSKK